MWLRRAAAAVEGKIRGFACQHGGCVLCSGQVAGCGTVLCSGVLPCNFPGVDIRVWRVSCLLCSFGSVELGGFDLGEVMSGLGCLQ